jgi:glycosyltransferase involved in cell wall biosynthesis
MRIAILADPVADSLGTSPQGRGDGMGATWLPHFATSLLQVADIEVLWLSLAPGRKSRRESRLGQHTLVELPRPWLSPDSALGYPYARKALIKEIRAFKPDVIHCWGSERSYGTVLGVGGVPSVFSLNGVLGILSKRQCLPPGWWWQVQAIHEARWMPRASMVTCESDWALRGIANMYPDIKCSKVTYGVHPSFYDLSWEPSTDTPTAFFAGTLTKGKGIDHLVNAMSMASHNKWLLKIAGTGPLEAELRARAPQNIRFLGLLKWQDLQRELRTSWCLVLPTLADSNPNVVKEARVVGLPVVTTRHGGQADYLRHGSNSLILDEPYPEALLNGMSRFLDHDMEELKHAGSQGHEEDRERFLVNYTVGGFLDIYSKLLSLTPSS